MAEPITTPGDRSPGTASASAPESERQPRAVASGPGRVLISVYGLFSLATCSRAGVQLVTQFHQAPVAYLLSAFSAVVYVAATVFMVRKGPLAHRLAVIACSIELIGVIGIGTFSVLTPQDFPHATVWSGFGVGYGYVPLVLPMIGLLWLRRTAPNPKPPS